MNFNDSKLLKQNHANVSLALTTYWHAVENSATMSGYGNEMAECNFTNDSVIIENLFDESVLKLSFSEWLYYLEEGKKIYLKDYPEDEEQINKWLEDYKKLTNLD